MHRSHRIDGVHFDMDTRSHDLFCWGCLQEIVDGTFEFEAKEERIAFGLETKPNQKLE